MTEAENIPEGIAKNVMTGIHNAYTVSATNGSGTGKINVKYDHLKSAEQVQPFKYCHLRDNDEQLLKRWLLEILAK